MTQNNAAAHAAFAPVPSNCTCGATQIEGCFCETTQADWAAAAKPAATTTVTGATDVPAIPVTESYTQKRSRIEAEADALRKRGSTIARKLLSLFTTRMDAHAKGPKAEAVAIARFEGACDALAALNGYTTTAWELAVLDPWRTAAAADGGRPVMSHGLGGNMELLRWEAELAEAIDAELAKLGLDL